MYVFEMYSISIHEYRAVKKVFGYNTNTCIHIFMNTEYPYVFFPLIQFSLVDYPGVCDISA